MNFAPRRTLGLLLGFLGLAILIGAIAVSIAQLGQGLISPTSLLWIVLLLVALPLALLVLNRLFGLITASYRVDRDGFYIRWGISYEQIPLDLISEVRPRLETIPPGEPNAGEVGEPGRPRLGFWWPGCLVGSVNSNLGGEVEFFATTGQLLIVRSLSERTFAISPQDVEAFHGAILSATRMGSLEAIPERSVRADFLVTRVWGDRLARSLILIGFLLPILLFGALVVVAPSLPELVPFGFGLSGQPSPLVPPGRLLLLPMIAGLIWIADLLVGAWFYGDEGDRPVAYALWGSAIAAGALLAGAAWQLITA